MAEAHSKTEDPFGCGRCHGPMRAAERRSRLEGTTKQRSLQPRDGPAILDGDMTRKFAVALPKDTEGETKNMSAIRLLICPAGALVLVLCLWASQSLSQAPPPADHPAVTVK